MDCARCSHGKAVITAEAEFGRAVPANADMLTDRRWSGPRRNQHRPCRIKQHRMQGTRGGDLLVTRRMRHHDQIGQPRLLGNDNVRFPPDHRGKTCRGLVGVRSRLGHSQAVLGCQPLEQVAHGAFLISVYSRVQHGQMCTPQSRDHDRRRECGRRGGGELKGQQNFTDGHQLHFLGITWLEWLPCRSSGGDPRVGRFHWTPHLFHRMCSNRSRH